MVSMTTLVGRLVVAVLFLLVQAEAVQHGETKTVLQKSGSCARFTQEIFPPTAAAGVLPMNGTVEGYYDHAAGTDYLDVECASQASAGPSDVLYEFKPTQTGKYEFTVRNKTTFGAATVAVVHCNNGVLYSSGYYYGTSIRQYNSACGLESTATTYLFKGSIYYVVVTRSSMFESSMFEFVLEATLLEEVSVRSGVDVYDTDPNRKAPQLVVGLAQWLFWLLIAPVILIGIGCIGCAITLCCCAQARGHKRYPGFIVRAVRGQAHDQTAAPTVATQVTHPVVDDVPLAAYATDVEGTAPVSSSKV